MLRKKRQVVIVDSLLNETEATVERPDIILQEVF